MELAPEDALRLNVLLAGELQALRIDESAMTVYGLSERGEAKIRLNPNCREDQYLRLVRETISGHVLGSPGGYPVYLKRWTRMGQARDESLMQLLMLGEPEAVAAVVHAPGLTPDLARRAWWAAPVAENARSMLRRDVVAESPLGPELAAYLAEYLPFETEPAIMVETVRLVLRRDLISADSVESIWDKGRHKTAYYVGFLRARPDHLPEEIAPHPRQAEHAQRMAALVAAANPYAKQLLRVMSGPGQTFLDVSQRVLKRPADQDTVLMLFDAVARYFQDVQLAQDLEADLEGVFSEVEDDCSQAIPRSERHEGLLRLLQRCPELKPEVQAMLVLARLGYPVVRPVFSRTTAIGSLMRKKLEPVTRPIFEQFSILQGTGALGFSLKG
jgi:hypothetical protein